MFEESSETKVQRIFLGNLPIDVKVSELKKVLPTGYDKSQIELKHNYDIDKNIISTFAFVNIEGTSNHIKKWCDEASNKSINNQLILVQTAKLSFLDRLKLEVSCERAKKEVKTEPIAKDISPIKQSSFKSFDFSKTSTSFDDSDDSEEETSEAEQKVDSTKSDIKKITNAETRRLESIKEKTDAHSSQQKIISMAIKQMSSKSSNRIKFQDSSDEDLENEIMDDEDKNVKKQKLFDESGSEADETGEFFTDSKRKTKLIKTKISNIDERFRMDSKFFDDEDDKIPDSDKTENEQDKMLKICNSIIEKDPLAKNKIKSKKSNDITIPTRYDPLQKDHSHLVIKPFEGIESDKLVKTVKGKSFRVTKDRFYEVSEDLKEQFKKNESSGFSLLGLFGGPSEVTPESSAPKDEVVITDSKPLKQKQLFGYKALLTSDTAHFFNVDNSDIEDEAQTVESHSKKDQSSWHEPLLITLNDPRVEEALLFFNSVPDESHFEISSKIKKIVKKKYRNNLMRTQKFKTKLGGRRKFQKGVDKKLEKRKR